MKKEHSAKVNAVVGEEDVHVSVFTPKEKIVGTFKASQLKAAGIKLEPGTMFKVVITGKGKKATTTFAPMPVKKISDKEFAAIERKAKEQLRDIEKF
jgi:hypothetical protein